MPIQIAIACALDAGQEQRLRGVARRQGTHHERWGRNRATVMRHFLAAALSISVLAIRMGVPALAAPLVPVPGSAE
jgi:hypothetical protein